MAEVIIDVSLQSIFLVTGLTGNMFILIVNFRDWQRTHDLNPCSLIINSIGIFNIMLQVMVVFQEISISMFGEIYSQEWVIYFVFTITTSLSFSSLWCATCLCFYYCVKIVNLSRTLFYKLKAKLPTMVRWLLVLSVLLSWCAGIPAYWDLYMDVSVTQLNITGNLTILMSSFYIISRCSCLFPMYIIVASVALAIIFLTAGAIFTSLLKHMRRMRQNNEGHSRINSHLSSAKTVTSLLIIYLIFYSAFTFVFYFPLTKDGLVMIVCFIVISSFPTINAIILILGNRKLINALKNLLGMETSGGNTEITVIAA